MGNNKINFFIDDNIFGNLEYSEKLFKALIPLKTKWCGQASLNMATKDSTLLKLAKKSGCIGLFVGLESVNNLQHGISNKIGSSDLHDVSKKIKMILRSGILVQSSMIFGLDSDDIFTFEKTVAFLRKAGVSYSSFCILTPYPGTKIYERFKKEGRLLHEDWSKYNNQNVVFKPVGLTPEQLKNGSDWAGNNLHTFGSIIERFKYNWRRPIYYLGMNLYTKTSNHRNHGVGSIDGAIKKDWISSNC